MDELLRKWLVRLGRPSGADYQPCFELQEKVDHPEFDGEWYRQANGPETYQRVLMVFPKRFSRPLAAVAVPFYFPEAMLGFEPGTGTSLPAYAGIEMMLHCVRRGFAAISADAFHLTYLPSSRDRGDFTRWKEAAAALLRDQPGWTGIGKLTADTRLLIDAVAADPRVDQNRIGIAGHSLGGKMAFYAGCLDPRIKAILASDFGIGWEQTNWNDAWYWGEKVNDLKAAGLDHSQLLSIAAPKPFCLLAGEYDDARSYELMQKAKGYQSAPEKLAFIHHASGHRPPPWALEKGYQFLETWLAG